MQVSTPLYGFNRMMKMQLLIKQCAHRKGWTFIELLMTIVILSIAAIVLVPSASSGASSSGQSATRLVVTDILAAQMDAVARQEFRRIHFFDDGSGWCVEILNSSQLATPYAQATAVYADDASESQGHHQKSYIDFNQDSRFKNISIVSPLFDGLNNSIIFDQTGGIIASDGSPSTGGSFEVHSGSFAWQIQLAPLTGKVTITKLGGTS
jgi:prepilin-type N-terminal cleavage/methylation domain-containing protein